MTISSIGPKCFKAREVSEGGNTVEAMIQGMRERGVAVTVTADRGMEKEFCIE